MTIRHNTYLAIMGQKPAIEAFAKLYGLRLFTKLNVFAEMLHPIKAGLCEAVIPPSSQLIGKDLGDLHMRRQHEIHVLAVYRDNAVYRGDELRKLILHSGDTLGMFCRWEVLDQFHKNPDFAVLTNAYPKEIVRPQKMNYALFSFIAAIILIFLGMPISIGLMLGAVSMVATGVLTVDEAYQSVSWSTVFLVAGLIPLGIVMQETHTVQWLTQHVGVFQEGVPLWIIQLSLALFTMLFSLAISSIGATVVLVPLAVDIALKVGADPRVFALTIALAANNTFFIPTNQVNALIAGPGGYQVKDFIKIGGALSLIYLFVVLVLLHVFF